MKEEKNKLAREVLTTKLNELAGICFAKWLMRQKDDETKKTAEAIDFFNSMFSGGYDEKDYMKPELDQISELLTALKKLSK